MAIAAHTAEIDVHVNVHTYDAPLPAEHAGRFPFRQGDLPGTWGEAIENRISTQRASYRNTYPSGSPVTGWSGN
jgi:hypothetical protein